MKVLLIDNGTTLLEKLEQLIPGTETVEREERFSVADSNPYDLVVLSGSSRGQLHGNEADFEAEISFIRSGQKPVVGICFGCELIVSAFGGELRELIAPSKGVREIEIVRPDLFNGRTRASVYESHRWAMTSVPAHFELLARSSDGPEIIRHGSFPIYGIQFHPENLVDTTEGDELFLSLFRTVNENRSK